MGGLNWEKLKRREMGQRGVMSHDHPVSAPKKTRRGVAARAIRLKYPGTCNQCGAAIAMGHMALWTPGGALRCLTC